MEIQVVLEEVQVQLIKELVLMLELGLLVRDMEEVLEKMELFSTLLLVVVVVLVVMVCLQDNKQEL